MYLGDISANQTLNFKFTTQYQGTPTTLAGTPAVSVYKSNNTTETTTGVTLSVDFDSRTGCHNVNIVTTDSFYAPGNDFSVVITAGTVGGISAVGYVLAEFSIENRSVADGGAISGTVNDAGATTTDFDGVSTLSSSDDFYNGSVLAFTSGTLKGIARKITDYTGSSRNLIFATAFPAAPANGDSFFIIGRIE
jgi:hypothetical protein